MREKIEAVRQVQDYENDIKDKLEIIIRHTYDPDIDEVIEFTVDGGILDVRYIYNFDCNLGRTRVDIPIAWLSEDFDYKSAYKKMKEARR